MAVNVRGVFLGCKYAIPAMERAGGGSIINIASFVALLGCSVPQDAYTASKGAVLSLTRSLAVQFGPKGIRTNAICPGPVETPLLMDWLVKDEEAKRIRLARNPTGRFGKPEEIVQHGRLPRLRRVALDERRVARRRWRHHGQLLLRGTAMTESTASSDERPPRRIGVDVGGSGIKAAVVDVDAGALRSERLRVPTPSPSTPDKVSASIGRLVRRLAKASSVSDDAPVGVGLPGVAIDGRLMTAANIDPAWVDYPIAEKLSQVASSGGSSIVNDADAAGIAEMRFGVGAGKPGTVIFLTLGTGVGSGVFVDGTLVPEHRVRPDGDPRPAGRAPIRGRRSRATRAVVEGVGAGPRRAPAADRGPDVADAVHRRRRRQQERRQVRAAADRAHAGRAGRAAERRRDHRRGDRGGRGARRRQVDLGRPAAGQATGHDRWARPGRPPIGIVAG